MMIRDLLKESKYLIYSGLLYVCFIVPLYWMQGHIKATTFLSILHLGSIASLYLYWRLAPWGKAKYSSFGSALLLITIGFRGIALLDTLIYGTRMDEWPTAIPMNAPFELLCMKGESLTQLGLLLTISAWRIAASRHIEELSLWSTCSRRLPHKPLLFLYAIALVASILFKVIKIKLGGLTLFFDVALFLGVSSTFFLALHFEHRLTKIAGALLMGLPLSLLALKSGMKEEIFFPLLPAFLITWREYKNIYIRLLMLACPIFILAIGQIYANYVRTHIWHEKKDLTTVEIAKTTFSSINYANILANLSPSFARVDFTLRHAYSVAIVERSGFYFDEVYAPLPATFIPRLLWPNKPNLQPGAAQLRRLLDSHEDITTMTSAETSGFIVEMYLGGGIMLMMAFSMLYGLLAGKLQVLVQHRLPAIATALFSYKMFYVAFRFDENLVVYAYTGLVVYTIVLWLASNSIRYASAHIYHTS